MSASPFAKQSAFGLAEKKYFGMDLSDLLQIDSWPETGKAESPVAWG